MTFPELSGGALDYHMRTWNSRWHVVLMEKTGEMFNLDDESAITELRERVFTESLFSFRFVYGFIFSCTPEFCEKSCNFAVASQTSTGPDLPKRNGSG